MKIRHLILLIIFSLSTNILTAQSAKPWVFWYWMQASVSKSGITADLEAMKEAGIGGAYLMPIKGVVNPPPYTPVTEQLSPAWWDMVNYSFKEAARLGLQIGMHVSDGFALAGGPWITPELSMQKVVWTQSRITGGKNVLLKLPEPVKVEDYYEDIAVYAYPAVRGTGQSTREIRPNVTTSATGKEKEAAMIALPGNKQAFKTDQPCWIQYAFEKPFTCRNIRISTGGNNYQAHRLLISVSDDGENFRTYTRLHPPRHGWQDTDEDVTHAITAVTARYFRFSYDPAGSEPGAEDLDAAKWKPSFKITGLELMAEPRIDQYEGKSGAVWRISQRTTGTQLSPELCVQPGQLINLTDKMNSDGTLSWKAPKGDWTILRMGHTSTGHTNATGGAGAGLESDKFNPTATRLQFDRWYGAAIKNAGPELAKKVLSVFHVDSWECGSQNWSPVFAAEFKRRRGYDLLPFLPVMAGIPLESAERSEALLYDIRKTIAELVADHFYKTLAELAKEKGVVFTAESVAPTMVSDGLLHYKLVDVPMGEFWLNSPTHDKPNDMLDAISGAHIYGKNIIQAEAFTTVRMAWNEHPGMLKTLQDRNYALGVNKMVYHVFTHNPWMDRKPGMTLDGVGLYFQRDQTWWKPGKAWVAYAERVQQQLQQGKPVTDLAVFSGEELPRRAVLPDRLVPSLPGIFGAERVAAEQKRMANAGQPLRERPAGVSNSANMADAENWVNPLNGYAYDTFNPDVLMDATVSAGRVVFRSGANYALLVIPMGNTMNPQDNRMSLDVLRQFYRLINAGATVIIGQRPIGGFGLLNKAEQQEMDMLAAKIWDGDFKMKALGKGKVIRGPYLEADFKPIGLLPDVVVKDKKGKLVNDIAWTHRQNNGEDIYFISNQLNLQRELLCSFRTGDKQPEFYDAVTDKVFPAGTFVCHEGITTLPVKLEPNASVFVRFRKSALKSSNKKLNWAEFRKVMEVSGAWEVQFDPAYGGPDKPVIFSQLADWTLHEDPAVRAYSGTAVYRKVINLKELPGQDIWLELERPANMAAVKINGIACGTLWTPPFRTPVGNALKAGDNLIEIAITNTWANRIIADQDLPEEKRVTKTTAPFRLKGKSPEAAGLIGSVSLWVEIPGSTH